MEEYNSYRSKADLYLKTVAEFTMPKGKNKEEKKIIKQNGSLVEAGLRAFTGINRMKLYNAKANSIKEKIDGMIA